MRHPSFMFLKELPLKQKAIFKHYCVCPDTFRKKIPNTNNKALQQPLKLDNYREDNSFIPATESFNPLNPKKKISLAFKDQYFLGADFLAVFSFLL